MRLLPVRPDHGGRGAAPGNAASNRCRDRRGHHQSLPLRHLCADQARHPPRHAGRAMRANSLGAGLIAGALCAGTITLVMPQPSRSQPATSQHRRLLSKRWRGCWTVRAVSIADTLTAFPRQGDDRHRHVFNVARGSADRGAPGLPCATCHGQANNAASGVPGAPRKRGAWPRSAWAGKGYPQWSCAVDCRIRSATDIAAALRSSTT